MENRKLIEVDKKLKNKPLAHLKEHLAIYGWKKLIPKIIWGIIIALAAFFLIKTAIWEYNYYQNQKGKSRPASGYTELTETLDETTPTSQQISEYTVPAANPRYLTIEKLGIANARIRKVGLKASTNQIDTPNNIFDAGWYSGSSLPGSGKTVIIDGHNGGPTQSGIFKNLPSLATGDIITIEIGNGTIFKYAVVENISIPTDEANEYMSKAQISPIVGKESLTLISCSGQWKNKTYDHRQFVRAILIES